MTGQEFAEWMMRRIDETRMLEAAYATPLTCMLKAGGTPCTAEATLAVTCALCGRFAGVTCGPHGEYMTGDLEFYDTHCGQHAPAHDLFRLEAL